MDGLGQTTIDITTDIAFFDGVAFVKFFLSLRQPDLAFGMTAFRKINSVRNDGQSFLCHASLQFLKFGFVEQQFAGSFGVVLGHAGMFVFPDMQVFEEEFAMLKQAIGIAHVGLAKTEGFDFCTFQHHACFKFLKQVVFVPGFAVEDFQNDGFEGQR